MKRAVLWNVWRGRGSQLLNEAAGCAILYLVILSIVVVVQRYYLLNKSTVCVIWIFFSSNLIVEFQCFSQKRSTIINYIFWKKNKVIERIVEEEIVIVDCDNNSQFKKSQQLQQSPFCVVYLAFLNAHLYWMRKGPVLRFKRAPWRSCRPGRFIVGWLRCHPTCCLGWRTNHPGCPGLPPPLWMAGRWATAQTSTSHKRSIQTG